MSTVSTEADAVNRIHAPMMAFDCLRIISFSKVFASNGVAAVGGSFVLAGHGDRRRQTPGLQFIIVADQRKQQFIT